jgi:hypothetical protein
MRQIIPSLALVSLFSVLVFQTNGRPTSCNVVPYVRGPEDQTIDITDICVVDSTEFIRRLPFGRRAGAGSRPGGGGKDGDIPGGGVQTGAGTPGSTGDGNGAPTDSTGEGGMGLSEGTTGGLGDPLEETVPEAQEFPPSARNNQNQPATSEQKTFDPQRSIDTDAKRQEFKNIIHRKGLEGGPWFFYSGFEDKDVVWQVQKDLSKQLGLKKIENGQEVDKVMPYLQDAIPPEGGDVDRTAFVGTENEKFFWALYSKVFSDAITGKVYITIPKDQPINMPKSNNDGSVWWSFEAPALTRNPDITDITYVSVDTQLSMDLEGPMYDLGSEKVIWVKGDEPLGFPGDEHYLETKPKEPWNG